MIELIFAIGVIGIGLLAATTLVFSNLMLADRDKSEIVAINLAREGLELAKNSRDTNWLAGNAFDAGMYAGTDYTATPVWTGLPGTSIYYDFTANDFTNARTKVMVSNNATTPNFMENWNTFITGTTSTFSRLMYFHPICDGIALPLDSGSACPAPANPKIGVRVESHIQWSEKGVLKNTVMYDDLYDWR